MLTIFLVLALAIVPTLASAAVSSTDIVIGGQNQEASNPLRDNGARVIQVTGTVTFTNDDLVNDVILTINPTTGVTKLDQKYTRGLMRELNPYNPEHQIYLNYPKQK